MTDNSNPCVTVPVPSADASLMSYPRLMLVCAALLPLVMSTACGQKGALYLPPRNGTVVTRPAAPGSTTPPSTDQEPGAAAQAAGDGKATDKKKDDSSQSTTAPPPKK